MGKKKQSKEPGTRVQSASSQPDKVQGTKPREEKGKKTYSLQKTEGKAVPGADQLPKLNIPRDLEHDLLSVIQSMNEERKINREVSIRLTNKKLMDLYNCLNGAGFAHKQIEQSMENTVLHGGDLIDALDWLCLNTPNDKLPSNFSQALQKEEEKNRPKQREPFQDKPGPREVAKLKAKPAKEKTKPTNGAGSTKAMSRKDWILQYAELESDESDDEGEKKDQDPNERYLELTALLLDAKAAAVNVKREGDKQKQKEISKTIRQYLIEMESLESHADFNPDVKLSMEEVQKEPSNTAVEVDKPAENFPEKNKIKEDKPENDDSGDDNSDDDGDLGFSMFEAAEAAPPEPQEKKEKPVKVTLDVRNFEYTRQQWTGKSPKQFLIDWCRKHLQKSLPPKYEKVGMWGNKHKSKVKIDRKKDGGMLELSPDILCENVKDAEHLASTLALYHLCRGQPVYQLLPPPYRDVWLEWLDAEKKAKEEQKTQENKPRDQFLSKLMSKIQLVDKGRGQSSTVADDEGEDEETMESWEDLEEAPEQSFEEVTNISKSSKSSKPQKSRPIRSCSTQRELYMQHTNTSQYEALLKVRQELPVFQHHDKIIEALTRHNVILVAGETGSGKSTQVPHFILKSCLFREGAGACNIVCTQPRRISATSLAQRVSQEMGEQKLGDQKSLCGYQIRFESRCGPNNCLTYCTTGVLLRKLQSDPELKNVSHILVDEVHERSVQSDFLLIILRQLLQKRPDLKVVLMSATLDADKFSRYFSHCPVINIPGRTFPVEVFHVEDIVEQTGYVLDEDSPYALRQSELLQFCSIPSNDIQYHWKRLLKTFPMIYHTTGFDKNGPRYFNRRIREENTTVAVTEKGGNQAQVNLFWTKEDLSTIDKTTLSADDYSLKTRNTVTRMNLKRINLDFIVEILLYLEKGDQFCGIEGAVLIFLPGLADITELYEMLQSDRRFMDTSRYRVIALHSVLSSSDQAQAFTVPPPGVRKVVLATNIAETGITIPDVVYVIDTGKVKETRYMESSQMSALTEVFISRANAKQRQGRAGRVRHGYCFRLFTKQMYDGMKAYTVPELLRVPLEELCLHIMKCNFGRPEAFLAQALDPPQSQTVNLAMSLLHSIGACVDGDKLSPLGHHLAALPVHVRIGKMLLYAAVFGCLEPVAVIAAAMTNKSPFVAPIGKQDLANAAKMSLATAASDHITLYKAYLGWKEARSKGKQADIIYCQKNFLKRNTMLEIENVKVDLMKLVHSIGFTDSTKPELFAPGEIEMDGVLQISKHTTKSKLDQKTISRVKAVLTAGLYPNVAKVAYEAPIDAAANPEQKVCIAETPQGPASVHPASINRMLQANGWLVFHEKVKSSRIYLRDCTLVSAYPLLLFGGQIEVQHVDQVVSIDHRIQYKAYAKTGVIFKELRKLLDELLARKLEDPKLNIMDKPLVGLIEDLLAAEKAR